MPAGASAASTCRVQSQSLDNDCGRWCLKECLVFNPTNPSLVCSSLCFYSRALQSLFARESSGRIFSSMTNERPYGSSHLRSRIAARQQIMAGSSHLGGIHCIIVPANYCRPQCLGHRCLLWLNGRISPQRLPMSFTTLTSPNNRPDTHCHETGPCRRACR